MKNFVSIPVTIAVALGLSGCGAWHKPSRSAFDKLPIVEFGRNVPAGGEFILFFPAGKPIPVKTSIKGTALAQTEEKTLEVALKKDVYAYKEWASFDRKTWKDAHEILDVNLDIEIPSPEHPHPGSIQLQVDWK